MKLLVSYLTADMFSMFKSGQDVFVMPALGCPDINDFYFGIFDQLVVVTVGVDTIILLNGVTDEILRLV